MRHRKLRIAWSVGCAVACVLLIALWVRSYFVGEYYGFNTKSSIFLARGELAFCTVIPPTGMSAKVGYGSHRFERLSAWNARNKTWNVIAAYGSNLDNNLSFVVVRMPALATAFALMAIMPLFPFSTRFSLRTLLIATTLVAVVLGLLVALR